MIQFAPDHLEIERRVEALLFAARDRFDALMAGRVEAAKGPDVGEAQA